MTGSLHLGHALTVSIEDSLVRFHRMKDENVNWVPGMDHAGIATQALFDKELKRNGESKEEIGREMYVDMVGIEKHVKGKACRMESNKPASYQRAIKIDGWSVELVRRSRK